MISKAYNKDTYFQTSSNGPVKKCVKLYWAITLILCEEASYCWKNVENPKNYRHSLHLISQASKYCTLSAQNKHFSSSYLHLGAIKLIYVLDFKWSQSTLREQVNRIPGHSWFSRLVCYANDKERKGWIVQKASIGTANAYLDKPWERNAGMS